MTAWYIQQLVGNRWETLSDRYQTRAAALAAIPTTTPGTVRIRSHR